MLVTCVAIQNLVICHLCLLWAWRDPHGYGTDDGDVPRPAGVLGIDGDGVHVQGARRQRGRIGVGPYVLFIDVSVRDRAEIRQRRALGVDQADAEADARTSLRGSDSPRLHPGLRVVVGGDG